MKPTPRLPRDYDEEAAKYERYCEVVRKDYARTRKERRERVRHFTLFSAQLMFDTFNDAMQARAELRRCRYTTSKFFRDLIPTPDATFVEVYRSSRANLGEDALWEQLEAIIAPQGGEVTRSRPDRGSGIRGTTASSTVTRFSDQPPGHKIHDFVLSCYPQALPRPPVCGKPLSLRYYCGAAM